MNLFKVFNESFKKQLQMSAKISILACSANLPEGLYFTDVFSLFFF